MITFLRLSPGWRAAALLALATSPVTAAEPTLTITMFERTASFTATAIAAMPHREAVVSDQKGHAEVRYSGVPLRDLLVRAGAPGVDKFRGKAVAVGVVAHCKDGYTVLYSLGELTDGFSSHEVILADRADGNALPPSEAPFRIVVAGDPRQARSPREVTALELISVAKH